MLNRSGRGDADRGAARSGHLYQPARRAWQGALTQSALYLAVAALFLGLAWWRTLRPDQ